MPQLSENAHCSLIKPSKLVGDSWVLLIVKYLINGPKRFNQLKLFIPEITSRVLTQRLKFLMENGLIERTHYTTISNKVEYHLTPKGSGLRKIIEEIEKYGDKFLC